jgi:urea carboxylase system permease
MRMTAVPPTVTPGSKDSGDLTSLGYRQELHRGLGPFASFASGFSFVSILTTVFQLFIIGFGFGGPAYIWTWPIVFVGQFCVCLVFAELAARYPIAGAIYQWSRRVSTDPLGWMAGWLMQIGYIISVAAIAIALQAVLPEVWGGFQLIGTDTSPTSEDGAANAIVLGSICIALCIAIASFGVTKMAMITRIGVTIEIIGVVVVLVLLFTHVVRGPDVVFETNGVQGDGSYIGPFLASMLMAAYVMYGFDSAAELSEETNDPRRTAPRAITRCMLVSAVGGGLMILGTLLAAPDILAPELATQGIAYVLTTLAGPFWGPVVLAIVGISIFSAALAISASATRVMFSMARDGRLPFAKALVAAGGDLRSGRSGLVLPVVRADLDGGDHRARPGRLPRHPATAVSRAELSNVGRGWSVVVEGAPPSRPKEAAWSTSTSTRGSTTTSGAAASSVATSSSTPTSRRSRPSPSTPAG